MTYREALEHFRTQVGIADALGIKQPAVSLWGGVIPPKYQYQLEIITAGALVVDPELRAAKNEPSTQQSAHGQERGRQQA